MLMSLSGFSDSRCKSWAHTRLAIVSSIGVPRKMMCSLSRREYRSKARSPRFGCRVVGSGQVLGVAGFRGLICVSRLLRVDIVFDVEDRSINRVSVLVDDL